MPNERLTDWIGRVETADDIVSQRNISGLRAVLDHEDYAAPNHALPQCGHWTLAPSAALSSETGLDGHIRLGRFLPPVRLPRRMWAASKVEFHAQLHVGMQVNRRSEVKSITDKTGSTGALVFVEVDHVYRSGSHMLVTETQTIVYREAGTAERSPSPVGGEASTLQMQRSMTPDAVTLFRYSALTCNAHRIHYDRPYAITEEGYRDLVVHGPLLATLLADLVARHHGPGCLKTLSFRGQSPAFVNEPVQLAAGIEGDKVRLRASCANGQVLMKAEAPLTC